MQRDWRRVFPSLDMYSVRYHWRQQRLEQNLNWRYPRSEWVNTCWWGWQNTTVLEKCTQLYDVTQGTIKRKRFRQRVFFGWKKIFSICLLTPGEDSLSKAFAFNCSLCQCRQSHSSTLCVCVCLSLSASVSVSLSVCLSLPASQELFYLNWRCSGENDDIQIIGDYWGRSEERTTGLTDVTSW